MKKLAAVTALSTGLILSGCLLQTEETAKAFYTGKTTSAVITQDNSDQLASTALQSGDASLMGSEKSSKVVQKLKVSGVLNKIGARATESTTTAGTCGGTLTQSTSSPDSTGTTDLSSLTSITTTTVSNYANYCEGIGDAEITTNGSVSVTMVWGDSMSFDMMFDNFTVTDIDGTMKMQGSMKIEMANLLSNSLKITISSLEGSFTDGTITEQFKMANMVMTVDTDVSGATLLTMKGRVYDGTLGYFDIDTPTSLTIPANSELPTAGVMTLTGANNVTATITINGDGTYTSVVNTGTTTTSSTGQVADL